jgi:hypothetical protein
VTAKEHNKLVGYLFLGVGVFELVMNIFSALIIPINFRQVISEIKNKDGGQLPWWFENLSTYLVVFVVVITLLLTIPKIIAGYAIVKQLTWGRTFGIVAGILSLISIPVGTALGIYALWFLFDEKGKRFYLEGENQQSMFIPPHNPQ